MRAIAAIAFTLALAAAGTVAPARAEAVVGCTAFQDAFNRAAGEHRVNFVRSLTVRSNQGAGLDYYDSGTQGGEVDLSVACRGDVMVRFETRLAMPARQAAIARFDRYGEAGLQAAMAMDAARAASTISSMSNEAQQYLNASIQRGDHYVSGKVERHMGARGDLGLIFTAEDRSLIVIVERSN